jgi:hypothetical protein
MCCSSLQSVSVHLPRSVAISEHAKQVIFLLLACPVFGHPPPDTVIFFISGSALSLNSEISVTASRKPLLERLDHVIQSFDSMVSSSEMWPACLTTVTEVVTGNGGG